MKHTRSLLDPKQVFCHTRSNWYPAVAFKNGDMCAGCHTTVAREHQTCECEHVAHFERTLTPHGNAGHKYGARFVPAVIVSVKTPVGTFKVCRDCEDDCLHLYRERTTLGRWVDNIRDDE